jgi:hypothetical protein
MSGWEKFVNLHGLLAMLSLIWFGAGIVLYFVVKKSSEFIVWLQNVLLVLFLNLVLLDFAGLAVYIPYRAVGGPRTILKASESTAWLHAIVFEHKEFLAFAPPLLILVAYLVSRSLGENLNHEKVLVLRRSVLFSLTAALVIVLLIAAEAVLVAKAAPLK